MTPDHPITPPPELVSQWFLGARAMPVDQWVTDVATQAARWGADQELEACAQWVDKLPGLFGSYDLRIARRPKPPRLKEQALALLEPQGSPARLLNEDQMGILRRALEQLDD